MKKIIGFLFTAIMLIGLVVFPTTPTQATKSEVTPEIQSIENYTNYLKKLAAEDSKAGDVLEKFLNLSKKEQELFLEALQPENYISIFNKVSANPNKDIEIQLSNGTIPVKMTLNKKESFKEDNLITNSNTIQSTWKITTPWAYTAIGILGIKTSEFALKMVYQSNGTSSSSVALKVYDVEKNYWNYNPAIWTSEIGFTNQYVSSGYAYGGYMWKLHSTGTLGFISANYDMYLKAKPGIGYHKVNSGHHNLGHDWERYF